MEALNELHWRHWFSIENSSLFTVAENSSYLYAIQMSSLFSQHSMRYYFSWGVYLLNMLDYYKNETMSQIPGHKLKISSYKCTHPKPCTMWTIFFYQLYFSPTLSEFKFSILHAWVLATGMRHTAEPTNEYQDRSSQSLYPIVSHLKWITMGH